MVGKFGLSDVTAAVGHQHRPAGRLPRATTSYNWEVLAIERSGNQTLSYGVFKPE